MFVAGFDEGQQLLTVRFTGHVSPEEMQESAVEIRRLVANAAPGWRLLTDLSALGDMDNGCVRVIREIMEFCNSKAVAMVVRVIPDARKDVGYGLLTIFHYDPSVRVYACETIEHANRLLAL